MASWRSIFSEVANFVFFSAFALHPAQRACPSFMTTNPPHFLQKSIESFYLKEVFKGCGLTKSSFIAWTKGFKEDEFDPAHEGDFKDCLAYFLGIFHIVFKAQLVRVVISFCLCRVGCNDAMNDGVLGGGSEDEHLSLLYFLWVDY